MNLDDLLDQMRKFIIARAKNVIHIFDSEYKLVNVIDQYNDGTHDIVTLRLEKQ